MTDLKTTLVNIVSAIVDDPKSIIVNEKVSGDNVTLELSVAPSDMGKVIGKHGKIAKAIRQIIKTAAVPSNRKVTVDIKDEIEISEQ